MRLVDVNVGDVGGRAIRGDPTLEEVEHELLVGGAEAEAWRPPPRRWVLHLAGRMVGGVLSAGSTRSSAYLKRNSQPVWAPWLYAASW